MKIAIPANGSSEEAGISRSFGRAPFFLIYDSANKQSLFLENDATQSPNGAGVRASQFIIKHDVDVVLTPRCGGNAVKVLDSGEIDVYKTIDGSIQDNLSAFRQGKLSILDQIQAGHHGNRI